MSSDSAPTPLPTPVTPRDRRHSMTPGTSQLSSYFSQSRAPPSAATTPAYPGPIASAAAQARERRMSLGNGSPPQLNLPSLRRGSVSSINSNATGESAVDDENETSGSPQSPFARRMSWGAMALRDVKLPQLAPKTPGAPGSPTVTRGFWLDNNRPQPTDPAVQQRRQSISTMPAPPVATPPPRQEQQDHFQERMLKGELYMD